MRWCLMATIVLAALAAACDRPAVMKIEDVHVNANSSRLIFNYRTQTPTGDCKAQAAEMPKVWDLIVKSRLQDSSVPVVVLFPEDPSGQSVGFEFTKGESGWSSPGPCLTIIPAR